MLYTLLFALWFQDQHATQVKYTAGNHSINIAAEYTVYVCVCVLKPRDFMLLLNIYEVVAIFKCLKYTLKGRELAFAVLIRLLNCHCSSIKN